MSPVLPLAGYALLTAGNLVGVGFDLPAVEWATKPLLMPMLAVLLLTSGGLRLRHGVTMVTGLAAATVADVALLIEGDTAFLVGMGFFLVMQVCYITVFLRMGAWNRIRRFPWLVSVFALVLAAFLVPLWNQLGDMAVPIAGYGTALATMAMFAVGLSNRLGLGGVLFLISDLLIGVGVAGVDFTGRGLIIMATYIAAQYLIVSGWLTLSRHPGTGH
ncbi:lysoplasmalogenase [Stackebrandtia albiflava]|uniref:lysoplasmalogenase n=1 Tax=Stackebrandtia albiflava TaxID=406432 RepID=UPI001B86B25A|nr:lysoplasmalogenase [Stackebrandtia albiflava]